MHLGANSQQSGIRALVAQEVANPSCLTLEVLLIMALEESTTTSDMIKLDSSNYSLWKPMMEDILYCKNLYEPIVKDKIPTDVMEEEWRVLHRKDSVVHQPQYIPSCCKCHKFV